MRRSTLRQYQRQQQRLQRQRRQLEGFEFPAFPPQIVKQAVSSFVQTAQQVTQPIIAPIMNTIVPPKPASAPPVAQTQQLVADVGAGVPQTINLPGLSVSVKAPPQSLVNLNPNNAQLVVTNTNQQQQVPVKSGLSTGAMIGIGAGVLGLVAAAFVLKRRS